MKNLIVLAVLLFSLAARGATSTTIAADVTERFQSAQSLLQNGNFGNGLQYWTATGLTAASVTTAANVARGDKSASIDPSATGQYFTSTAVAIPAGLYARNGLGRCLVKTAATDLLLQAYDGSNILSSVTIPASSTFIPVSVNFIFPSSGNISLRFASQSDSAIAYVDDCYLGDALNLTQVSQAQFVGSIKFPTAANCYWDLINQTTYASFPVDSDCSDPTVTGDLAVPATKIPSFKITSGGPGRYVFILNGHFTTANGGSSISDSYSFYQLTDGTTSSDGEGSVSFATAGTVNQVVVGSNGFTTGINYPTGFTNKIFEIKGKTNSGATYTSRIDRRFVPLSIEVYRFPTSSQIAVTPDLTQEIWSGYGSIGLTATSVDTNYSDRARSGWSFTAVKNTLQVEQADGTIEGFKITPKSAGTFMFCYTGNMNVDTGSWQSVSAKTRVVDGNNNVLLDGQDAGQGGQYLSAYNGGCGIYTALSTSPFTIKFQHKVGSGSYTTYSQITNFSIVKISQSLPNPVILNQVSSVSSAGKKRLTATLNCDSGSAITSQDGSTSEGVASIGNISSGGCAITFAGMGSTTPRCQTNILGTTLDQIAKTNATSSTAATLYGIVASTGAALTSFDADIDCEWSK